MNGYEVVIGLEIHVELKTKSKIFCSCPTVFGAAPNTQVCPICLGLPGTLPTLNRQAVEYAVTAGLALDCEIARYSKFDRKNYTYPDLPKAYQISQYDLPICRHGRLSIATDGGEKDIGITRIHLEEDAGKLIHSPELGTLIDCNRCGVPLIEIVTEPDIRSAAEAVAFLEKLRATIVYTGVSDCKMNEGSLRCDVNLSVRRIGDPVLGTRTETKNLNSFQSVRRAIEYETERQIALLDSGEKVVQETRRFDQSDGRTYTMRRKEDADDYRYFPDPDLAPISLDETYIESIRRSLPVLPEQRKRKYVKEYGLTASDAQLITGRRDVADHFEAAAVGTRYPKTLANLLITEGFRMLEPDEAIPVSPESLARLAELVGNGEINSGAGKRVLCEIWEKGGTPDETVDRLGLRQLSDEASLRAAVDDAIKNIPAAVADYKNGKTKAFGAIMGQAMRATGGRADPEMLKKLILEALSLEE